MLMYWLLLTPFLCAPPTPPQWDDIPDALPGSSAVVRSFGGASQPSDGGSGGSSSSSSCTDKPPNGGQQRGAHSRQWRLATEHGMACLLPLAPNQRAPLSDTLCSDMHTDFPLATLSSTQTAPAALKRRAGASATSPG